MYLDWLCIQYTILIVFGIMICSTFQIFIFFAYEPEYFSNTWYNNNCRCNIYQFYFIFRRAVSEKQYPSRSYDIKCNDFGILFYIYTFIPLRFVLGHTSVIHISYLTDCNTLQVMLSRYRTVKLLNVDPIQYQRRKHLSIW